VKIVVAGGTGFVGKALVKRLLDENHQVLVLSRKVNAFKNSPYVNLRVGMWDGQPTGPWERLLEDADAVVNLCGEGIADRHWSSKRKNLLRSSRLDPTKTLVEAISRCVHRPKVLVNVSAVGYYGAVKNDEVDETHLKGTGFLADLCAEWEAEARKAQAPGTRVALLRLGVVIEKDGGALQKLIAPFRWFVGGPLGSGRQWFPWVHRDDVVGAILYVLQKDALSGPVNVVAPETSTMNEFCRTLGKAMGRPCWARVPGFALKILLGEMSGMLLEGQKAVPRKLREAEYTFIYCEAKKALFSIFSKNSP
jgi:uncharacterized protein (TIGR01777 family)